MSRTTKLLLDIVIGAVIPILVLNNLSQPLGAPTAYVVAALIPVAWVLLDLFVITRKFNFITSYVGLTSIVSGALAFWFVDGLLFAAKDTASFALRAVLFAGSLLVARPLVTYFFAQTVEPDTPARQSALDALLREPDVLRVARYGTLLVAIEITIESVVNFLLNLNRVTAPFGTELFNQQVAQVNAITRLAFPIPSILVLALAIGLMYRAVYRHLPSEGDKPQIESEFWDLVDLRAAQAAQTNRDPQITRVSANR